MISKTSEVVDDFCTSLYPPVNRQEVVQVLPPLVTHLESLLASFKCVSSVSHKQLLFYIFESAIIHVYHGQCSGFADVCQNLRRAQACGETIASSVIQYTVFIPSYTGTFAKFIF